MIGDMASSIFGKSNVVEANDKVDSVLQASSTETGSGIRQRLESVQTAEERAFRDNLALGYGIGSPLHLVRLYDTSNRLEDIRVTFYRDSASWCKSLALLPVAKLFSVPILATFSSCSIE